MTIWALDNVECWNVEEVKCAPVISSMWTPQALQLLKIEKSCNVPDFSLVSQGSLYAIAVDPARHFMRFPALPEDIRDILSQNQIKSKPTICTLSCHLVFVPWSNYLGPGPFDFTSHSKGFAGWFELVEPSTGRVRKWAPWVGHSCSSDTSNRYSISSACASAGISYNTHLAS